MSFESYKDEKNFRENCPCFYTILEFVENEVDTDVRWYFNRGYSHPSEKRYTMIFTSYDDLDYEDYILSIECAYRDSKYECRIVKKIDGLSPQISH